VVSLNLRAVGVSCVAVLGLLLGWGAYLGSGPVTQAELFWAFHAASLLGTGLCATALVLRHPRPLVLNGAYAALLALAWRLGYFPILVFSGVAASAVDWALPGEGRLGMGVIYACFLCFVCVLHVAVAGFLFLATRPAPAEPAAGLRRLLDRRLLLAFAVSNLLVALAVSVIEPEEDLTLLPDWPQTSLVVPQVHVPARNPYLSRVTEEGATIQERILAFNAGMTYELIPPSRWGNAVKGTLEHLCFQNPQGSSADRVLEHHLAYLAADALVRAASEQESE
jgi:hypothetical protein